MSVKGTENIAKYWNDSIGTERISVHSRTERTNICVEKYFRMTHGRIRVFDWRKEYQNKFQNSDFMEYVREFLD